MPAILSQHPSQPGTDLPTDILFKAAEGVCQKLALQGVGAIRQEEVEQHIADCGARLEEAYARFEETDNPHDRDEACMWLHLRNQALLATRWAGAPVEGQPRA